MRLQKRLIVVGAASVLAFGASAGAQTGNRWLGATAERLKSLGFGDRVVLDESAKVAADGSLPK
jgi:hypothetical protein